MNNKIVPTKVFIKSNNDYNKIINKYNISLILFTIITIIINLLIGNKELTISLLKTLFISFTFTSILTYIYNIIKKQSNILKMYTNDSIISISIVLALFSVNTNIFILLLAILITIIVKNTFKNINISSVLYGILIITLYKYFNNNMNISLDILKTLTFKEVIKLGESITNYLFGITYLNPIISIMSFIYLFYHKSIKYNLVFSYIITFILIITLYGILSGIGIWLPIYELLTDYLIFLSIYTLTDYKMTPTISEGNIIYGIILGIISSILKIIIPSISIILTFILGPLLLTNIIDKISPKLKYNNKLYFEMISIIIVVVIIALIIITIV